ncbi:M20/M25/M40 family metallo-hydrolase [uncultured Sphingomonas sp.]|uniref:M20/M25/M40 family metallo-hydrolase n=1 Tax=uncultured Sphingomonas sp. TaxID=158754 RepID=UPI0025FB649C|nr:M20/M25/M40 family metallo-hydrolase [uncultured Sphingomonas sp.]
MIGRKGAGALGLALAALLSAGPAMAQTATPTVPADAATIRSIRAQPAYRAAVAALEREHDEWVETIVRLTEIPAPPFKESRRAQAYAGMFRAAGLTDVEIDDAGNVLGLRRGTAAPGGKVVIMAAHLDTVFPEGTPIKVRREGTRLHAPGVGDDSTGLATQLSLIKAMAAARVATPMDILFVGDVGEEGLGDLRGVRHLFGKGKYKGRAAAFFSLDGAAEDGFTIGGVGSKRYRLTFTGPGGHSYGAFGLVNPMGALAGAITGLYGIPVPANPKTTYSGSVVSGGTSVNAIPREVTLEVDMRSESATELARLERNFIAIVDRSVAAENAARSVKEGAVKVEKTSVGDRPAGATPAKAPLVRLAVAAYQAEGISPKLTASSTDSNVPMGLSIPAITISRAAAGDRGHSTDEWIDTERTASQKVKRLNLLILLAAAGMR